ncbi:MAG: DUF5615 family PIN-like protein [Gemmatimonadaceae bacterium]|nr:DUF5615 family PIN-like protein [Gemmatimonadaceae bacterium]
MRVWIDAQLSPGLAAWLCNELGCEAVAVRDLGLRDAEDSEIFAGARTAGAVVLTKDADFADLVARFGPPPQIIWLTCGNTSNAFLRDMLRKAWPELQTLLGSGEPLVEISGRAP